MYASKVAYLAHLPEGYIYANRTKSLAKMRGHNELGYTVPDMRQGQGYTVQDVSKKNVIKSKYFKDNSDISHGAGKCNGSFTYLQLLARIGTNLAT